MATTRDLARFRLAALGLAGPGFGTPTEAVRWLTAVQAQDYPGALAAVALRTRAAGRAEVEAALDAGAVVRSWPMRGTLHFVAAEDLSWMLAVTGVRQQTARRARQRQLELTPEVLARGHDLAAAALSGGRALTRRELFAVWEEAGIATGGQRGVHLVRHLAHEGVLCLGPVRGGGRQRFVLLEEWVPRPRALDREEALAELALRYFRSHGPATVADLARWTKLSLTDARAGLAAVRGELDALVVGGTEYLMDPGTPALLDRHRERARGVLLLPGFDEYMLGYGDRTAALPAEHADAIVPGGNGVFRATVVSDGQVVGTWRKGTGGRVEATPFTAFADGVAEAVTKAYAELP